MAIKKKRPTRKPRSFKKAFLPYRYYQEDAQNLRIDGQAIPINGCVFERKTDDILEILEHPAKKNAPLKKLSKKAVERWNPNNIDSIQFWEQAVKYFPINAISGSQCMSVEDIHKNHEGLIHHEFFKKFTDHLQKGEKVLEIGVGYGSLYKALLKEERINSEDWNFLDVIKIIEFDHPNFYLGNGWDIPTKDGIPDKFDVVVSHNCFQHLSEDQRESYFIDVFDRLKSGGRFHFNTFSFDDVDHSNAEYFDSIDEDGYPLTNFFGQYTKCMPFHDGVSRLTEIGFKVVDGDVHKNSVFFHCIKP